MEGTIKFFFFGHTQEIFSGKYKKIGYFSGKYNKTLVLFWQG